MKCKDCSRALPKKGRNGSKPVRCKVCGLIWKVETRLGREARRVLTPEEKERQRQKMINFAQAYGAGPAKIAGILKQKYNEDPPPPATPTISGPAGDVYTILKGDWL